MKWNYAGSKRGKKKEHDLAAWVGLYSRTLDFLVPTYYLLYIIIFCSCFLETVCPWDDVSNLWTGKRSWSICICMHMWVSEDSTSSHRVSPFLSLLSLPHKTKKSSYKTQVRSGTVYYYFGGWETMVSCIDVACRQNPPLDDRYDVRCGSSASFCMIFIKTIWDIIIIFFFVFV